MTSEQRAAKPPILVRKEPPIGWVTFNRPEVRNALSFEMQRLIPEIMRDMGEDGDIRVVVLTGAGDRAFCAGADISEFKEKRRTPEEAQAHARLAEAAMQSIFECPKVVIAMINGFAVGNGYLLAMHCDLRVAADTARVGITSSKLGMSGGGAGQRPEGLSPTMGLLVELAGLGYAKEVMITGRLFPAERALRMGLVNEVVPAAGLERYTRELAKEIAGNAPAGVMSAKRNLNAAAVARGRSGGAQLQTPAGSSSQEMGKDYFEGVSAFLEKRKPRFTGR